MRLLLDTNIVIPVVRQKLDVLSHATVAAISSPENSSFVSIASLWEIAIKARLGKLDTRIEIADLPAYLADDNIGLIPILAEHVLAELADPPSTKDPFDRLLLAQCEVEGLRLVTRDSKLAKHRLAWRAP